ncbi:carbohydrate ABC transporter permease [Leeia sp.]|uniref:carbohydrate ABC transporter permease n=1 Tax=Leeia sp. TaxID=2884678 RepID=UPI0035B15036
MDLRTRKTLQRTGNKVLHYSILLALALFTCYPFLWLLNTALGTEGGVFDFPPPLLPRGLTLEHFRQVFEQFSIGTFFKNSVWISVWTIFWTLFLSSTAAYALSRMRFPGRNLVFTIIVVSMMLPAEVNFLPNYVIMAKLNQLMMWLADSTGWEALANIKFADGHLGVILPTVATGFGIFLMKQAFEEIPQDLIDAARIDGASEFAIFYKVVLPLTRPHLAALAIFTLVSSWNNFMWPSIVLTSPDQYPMATGVLQLFGAFQSSFRLTAAGCVIAIVPILLVFVFTQRYFMRGMEGAVK